MKVLERMAGPRQRAVPPPHDRRPFGRRAHQQPGVRRLPRLRRQPGPVRHGGRDGPAGRRGRDQRLGDPVPQRDHVGRRMGAGPDHGRRLRRRRPLPGGGAAALRRRHRGGQGGRRRPRAQELGPRQRLQGDRPRGRALRGGRHRRGAPLLDRDGPGRAHRGPPGGGGGAGCRPGPGAGDRRHHSGARRRPDHRLAGHADGRRLGEGGVRGGPGGWLPARRRLRGRVPRRLDAPSRRAGRRAPRHPLDVRLRRPADRDGPDHRPHRAGAGRPRRRAGR